MYRRSLLAMLLVTTILLASIPSDGIKIEDTAPTKNESPNKELDSSIQQKTDLKASGRILIRYKDIQTRDRNLPVLKNLGVQVEYVFNYLPMVTAKETSIAIPEATKIIPSYFTSRAMGDEKVLPMKGHVAGMTLEETAVQTNIYKLWEEGYTGKNSKWTFIDSGINDRLKSFEDSNGNSRVELYAISELANTEGALDLSGHGTHVAGIAAGNGWFKDRDGEMKKFMSHGMAPDATIVSIKVLNKDGYGDTAGVLEGIDMALKMNVSVISMSFGTEIYEGIADPHLELARVAEEKDILLVAAAGNSGVFGGSTIGLPAAIPSVLSVGAVKDRFYANDPYFIPWGGSSEGPSYLPSLVPKPDVLAPGVNIVSVNVSDNSAVIRTGTSMAVPHVSAGAVLLREAFPNATAAEIRYAIMAGAKDIYASPEVQGRGMVDFYKSFLILNGSLEIEGDHGAVSTPVAIHDGNDRGYTGLPNRSPGRYFSHSIAGRSRMFNITLFADRELNITSNVQYYYGSISISLPSSINLKVGTNVIPVNITISQEKVIYNYAVIYFVNTATGKMLEYGNVTYFSLSHIPRGVVLFDISKDNDTVSGFYGNDGPRGKYIELAYQLQMEGYLVRDNTKPLTPSILQDVDILVIADPELSYDSVERQAIYNFVTEKGGGLLILGNGGFLTAEGDSFSPFNYKTLNDILKYPGEFKSGIQFRIDETKEGLSKYRLVSGGVNIRSGREQNILSKNKVTEFYGPALTVDRTKAEVLFTYTGFPVAAATTMGKGRVMVYASNLPFDTPALVIGRYSDSDTEDARLIAIQSFDWLLEQNEIKVEYEIEDIDYTRHRELQINLYSTVTILMKTPRFANGTVIPGLPDTLTAYLIHDTYAGNNMIGTFVKNSEGEYTLTLKFDVYGSYKMFVPIVFGGDTTDGKLNIFVTLQFFDRQRTFNITARVIFIMLVISWYFWVKNEGGRKYRRYLKEQRKKYKN